MAKEHQNNDFDPSSDEDFIKTIESLFFEETDEDIHVSVDDSNIIEIKDEISGEGNRKDLQENEADGFKDTDNESENDHSINKESITKTADSMNDISEVDVKIREKTQNNDDIDFESIFEDLDINAPVTETGAANRGELVPVNTPDSTALTTDAEDDTVAKNLSEDDALLEDINISLAQQINLHLQEESILPKKGWMRLPLWSRILIIVAGFVLLFSFIMFKTPVGVKLISNLAARILTEGMVTPTPDENAADLTVTPDPNDVIISDIVDPIDLPSDSAADNSYRTEDYITNILLLGEETIDSYGSRGRTDMMMIATIDTKNDVIKLTTLMRDMLVSIPGYEDNRLNAAYAKGGIDLLYDTIERNFDISVDGYMLVGFESFEKIVDTLGGVDIEINDAEREWLNSTNYISNPEYRTLITGWNHLNGNQALGYCRIRQVATSDKKYSDFGRTSRQRIMLDAMFNEVKTKNALELFNIMNTCLPYVTTDISADTLSACIENVLTNKITTVEKMQIPVNGTYSDVQYNGLGQLISVNFSENIEALHEFIFGDYQE